MKNKKTILFLGIFLAGILLIGIGNSQTGSYCCEKTIDGAWCQNSPQEQCDNNFRQAPTFCESTSYCKSGTCINSIEGKCTPNTPQRVCENEQGLWKPLKLDEISQCEKGCCILGNQGKWATLTECKYLSSQFGEVTNFRTDINEEFECVDTVTSSIRGACVYEEDGLNSCEFVTRSECDSITGGNFNSGILCSAEELDTICTSSEKTKCYNEKVYFVDSCGNLANVYDASKVSTKNYWTRVISPENSCSDGDGSADSKTCGNCEYPESICKLHKRGDGESPQYGDYVCRDVDCKYEGATYSHGERWCAKASHGNKGVNDNLPGSEHFMLECRDGEVLSTACSVGAWRNTICQDSKINDLSFANCVVNEWHDCYTQEEQRDCENEEMRDCEWLDDYGAIKNMNTRCVPKYPPAFDFWNSQEEAQSYCDYGITECNVKYTKSLIGDWKCKENCHCLTEEWKNKMNNFCNSLGDCGVSKNYRGFEGWNELD